MGQMLSGYLKPLPFKNMRRLPLTLTVVPLLSSARSSECTETRSTSASADVEQDFGFGKHTSWPSRAP